MEDIQKFLRDCFPSVASQQFDTLIQILQDVGVEEFDDLQLLDPEKDFKDVLKPVQARKLKRKIDSTFNQDLNIDPQPGTSSKITEENKILEEKPSRGSFEEDSLLEIIPYKKFSKSIMAKLEKGERPTPAERREAVRVIVAAVMEYIPAPRKKHFDIVAMELVRRYPHSFKDGIANDAIGLGHSSLLCQLIARAENCGRNSGSQLKRTQDSSADSSAPKRTSDKYGCLNFQPQDFPEEEDIDTLNEKKKFLQSQFKLSNWDVPIIKNYMQKTFICQRLTINKKPSIATILEEWPFLSIREFFYDHCEKLLGFSLADRLQTAIQDKFPQMMNFFKNSECCKAITNVDLHPPQIYYLYLLATYFQEDCGLMMKIYEEEKIMNEIINEAPMTPFIACIGDPYDLSPVCTVIIEKKLMEKMIPLNEALLMWFGSFYIFNLVYPAECVATLEFIQRALFGINPESKGTKMPKRCGKRVSVHPKVLNILNKIKDFNSMWNL